MAGNEHPAPDSHAPLPARPVHHYARRAAGRQATEHLGVGIVEVSTRYEETRCCRVNQKVSELIREHEAADLLGRSIFDETFPQDVAQDLGQFEAALVAAKIEPLHH